MITQLFTLRETITSPRTLYVGYHHSHELKKLGSQVLVMTSAERKSFRTKHRFSKYHEP